MRETVRDYCGSTSRLHADRIQKQIFYTESPYGRNVVVFGPSRRRPVRKGERSHKNGSFVSINSRPSRVRVVDSVRRREVPRTSDSDAYPRAQTDADESTDARNNTRLTSYARDGEEDAAGVGFRNGDDGGILCARALGVSRERM